MRELLVVSSSPHIRCNRNIEYGIRLVTLALMPQFIYSSIIFGTRAIITIFLSVFSSIFFEFFIQKLLKKRLTISDGSAGLTGLLLAFTLPPGVPFWVPVIGSAFAIIVIKQLFGGIGLNIFNPALAGRAFLSFFWPSIMYNFWMKPNWGTLSGIETITGATPLSVLKNPDLFGEQNLVLNLLNQKETITSLFIGNVGGSIGETSGLLLLLGGIFLLYVKIIDYRIVVSYLASFIIGILLLQKKVNILFHIFSGGLLLGVFFMATDWVTSPITKLGRWLFGFGCGILTVIIRLYSRQPEGVCFAILLMNALVPFIDQITKPRIYGTKIKTGRY
ncbi:MAG: RnfABCDGE type electron transport complex subunit D [candidate division WOR-3 bacterium]